MATIDWSWKGFTDSELVKQIEELVKDLECKELLLYGNKLQNVPDLTKYKQFAGLTKLYFGFAPGDNLGNDLIFVQPELLPSSLTHLDLSHNKLTEVPDFSQCVNMEKLNLRNSNLSVVQQEHLPPNLTRLDLSWNKLTEVSDFSQCINLEELDLRNNNTSVVQWQLIPPSLIWLDLSGNILTEVSDFSQCVSMQELYLHDNTLSVVQPEHLPPNLEHLNLSLNRLTEVSDFSPCINLEGLDLGNNNISVVQWQHMPPSLTQLDLAWNILTEVPDFTQGVNIQEWYLYENNLGDVQPEHLPPNLVHLDLSNNQLTALSDFSQCVNMQELYLHHNNISVVQPEHLPPNLTHLNLYWNKLSEVSDFSPFVNLHQLNLRHNKIRVVQPEHLPPSVTYLDLSFNRLAEVSDFSQSTILEVLNLDHNNIRVVQPELLPPSLKRLNLSQNTLAVLQDFSQHKNLKDLNISDNDSLHTIHGLPESLEEFSCNCSSVKSIKKNAFHENTYELLQRKIFGETLKQPPYGVYIQGLDAVLDYFTETSVETTQNSMMLLGPTTAGKTSVMESLINEIPVLVGTNKRTQVANIREWNISDTDIIEVFDQGGHPIYNITNPIFLSASCMRFIVHDITKVEATQLEETSDILIQSLQLHPQSQVHVILTHIDYVDAVDIDRHKEMVKEKLEVTINQEVQNLGRLALSDKEEGDSKELLSRQLQQQKKDIEYFLVSNKTYEGLDKLKDFLMELIAQKRMHIPEKWVQFYKLMLREESEYFKVEDLKPIFEPLYSTSEYQEAHVTSLFVSALRHFRNSGLIMYFDNISGLDEYVFHKKTFLVELFKCCFHHDLMSTIDFKALEKLWHFKRKQAELMVKQYQTEGVLSTELLHYLWHKYGIGKQVQKAVLDLMKMFQLCHPINSSEELFFFPWFTQSKECPGRINPNKLLACDQNHFSVELNCKFSCSIPGNCFEVLLVQIQKIAREHQFGDDRYAWKDGLAVKVGTLECVAVRLPQKSTIKIAIQGHRREVDEVWEVMTIVHSDLKSYLKRLEGVIEEVYFTCNHCVIKNLLPYYQRHPTEVFKKRTLYLRYVECKDEIIPTTLVYAPPVNSNKLEDHLQNVQEYLMDNCKDTSSPGPLLYLDCEEVSQGMLLLSWCWPQSQDVGKSLSGEVDDTVTHAVVEYREGQGWTRLTDVRQSPFSLHCKAEEVRVAASNENGQGKFSYAKPCHVIDADETLTDKDREHLKANHEFFSRMTSVREIVLRLYSRGVLSKREKGELIRLVADEDKKKTAASHLMEYVERLRYKQLYLFKKTLMETGQPTMADTVPVKLGRHLGCSS